SILGHNLNPQHVEASLAQCGVLTTNVCGIVWCFECLADLLQRHLDSRNCFFDWNLAKAIPSGRFVRSSFVVEEQIPAADPVLVLVDSVHATHEHKAGTARRAQTFFEWLPI